MLIPNELYNLLQKLNVSLNTVLKFPYISGTEKKLEIFLYNLEKIRFEIYEQVRYLNTNMLDNEIHFIDNDYKANLQDGVLSLYIPEKLPNLTNRSSYAHKQIIFNIAEITKQYDKLFFDKYVIVIIKIFEKRKVWDADNRTVKPIQDGLIHGGVIKDDNIFNCCYMVQGFYSDLPHIEVSVLEADKIINFIDSNLPNISKWP